LRIFINDNILILFILRLFNICRTERISFFSEPHFESPVTGILVAKEAVQYDFYKIMLKYAIVIEIDE
jgi:hypothetical protein